LLGGEDAANLRPTLRLEFPTPGTPLLVGKVFLPQRQKPLSGLLQDVPQPGLLFAAKSECLRQPLLEFLRASWPSTPAGVLSWALLSGPAPSS
jgi:hypothetical protein